MGSILLSKGIKAKIDQELELVGSTIKGKKIKVEAKDINIEGKKVENLSETKQDIYYQVIQKEKLKQIKRA